jgi:tRNA A-37 threonylcarbamoyl transferase component Bud32
VVTAPDIPGYRIAGVLGKGGFATVYRGLQLTVGREVAVKVDNRVLSSERDRRRFVREVTAAGRLSGHPHVIDVYDAGMLGDGRPYLVMELCPGGSLDDVVRRDGPMPSAQARDIGVKIADALAAAHAAGILHRDIKPANILLNRYGMVGLSDFGLASVLADEGGQSVTREALTPAYASPESFHGQEPTATADLYSLTATLYALLAGRPPRFPPDGTSPSLATLLWLHDKPVDDIPGVPAELMAVLRGSLAADPSARPQSAAALRDTLLGLRAPGSGAPGSGAPAPAMTAAPPRAQSGPDRTITQDAWLVGSPPGSPPTKRLPPGAVPRRRGPGKRLVALAAGLVVIIAAAAASLAVLWHHDPAPGASTVLYSFKDGTSDGWRAGANVAVAAPVTSFLDDPRRPHEGTYALEGVSENDAPVSAPRTMTVTPASALNLSAARTFYLYLDGYGYPGVATGFTATVTLASGSRHTTKTVPVRANTWNRVDVSVSSWSYRDHVTGISVSFAGTGSTIGWNPNFQIDDVGYTT